MEIVALFRLRRQLHGGDGILTWVESILTDYAMYLLHLIVFFFIHRSRNTVALLFCPLNPTIEHVLFFFLFIFIFFFCAPTVAERHMAMTIKISDIPVLLSDIVASIPIQ